ncbi:MAG: LCP family protein, partial [Chloroflexota bacterium]|nr:LCP family protein [Chloroflexota bacterium]
PPRNEPYTGDTLPLPAASPRTEPSVAPSRQPSAAPNRRPVPRTPRGRTLAVQPSVWRLRRLLVRLGIGALVLLLLACVGLVVLQQQVARQVALRDVRPDRPWAARPLVSPANILLAGVDSRPDHPGEGIRSDSLLLLHLDPIGGWANLLTIPRDSLANVPGFGEMKINTAFARGHDGAEEIYGAGTERVAGGAALAADTVEGFLQLRDLGTRVHYVATVNFDGFAAMIDALGGIEVDVPRTIVDEEYPTPDFGTMRIEIPAGRQHFDGARALQYVRTRHADSDFGRAERQQQVLSAMVARLRSKPLPLQPFAALRLVRAAGAAIRTTMPVGRPDAFLLGLMLLRLDPSEIGQYRIEPDSVTLLAEQGSDLVWDPASVRAWTRQALARPSEAPEQAVVQVRNGAGVTGLAGQVSTVLSDEGFTTVAPETDEPSSRSMILDYTGKPRTRKQLQQLLGDLPVEERPASDAPPGVDLVVLLGDDYERFVPQR